MGGRATSADIVKHSDAASYDAVAEKFDDLTERLSAPIADGLLGLANISPSDDVLDVGTGTGLLALRAAALAPLGKVAGIDHSAGMLRKADQKARERGVAGNTSFTRMDAETLEFRESAFDVAVSLFVVLHLPAPLVAAKELHRVLKPGGRLVVGLGAGPSLLTPDGVIHAQRRLREILAASRGRLLTAPNFLRELLIEFGLQEHNPGGRHSSVDAGKLLADAGFTNIRSSWLGATYDLSVEDFWEVSATYGSAERMCLAELSPEDRAMVRQEFMRRAAHVLSRKGKLMYRCGARIYTASRGG